MKAIVHKCEWMNKELGIANFSSYETELPKKGILEFLQKLVGGLIEVYHHKGKDLVLNEEGLLLGLPLNPWARGKGLPIVGTIVEVDGILP